MVYTAGPTNAYTPQVARQQLFNNTLHRRFADFTGCTRYRIESSQGSGAVAGCKCLVAATTDLTGASGWTDLDGTSQAGAPAAYVDVSTLGQQNLSAEFVIAAQFRGLVLTRIEYVDGNGSTAYNLRLVAVTAY